MFIGANLYSFFFSSFQALRLTILVYTPTSPQSSCRAILVMLGECVSLTLGNTSHTPGGLPGMLLNNEVHSLTSPSKAKFPRCPFQQPLQLLLESPYQEEEKKHIIMLFPLTGSVVACAGHEE